MTAAEIVCAVGGGGVVVFLLGIIKVKPLEISVWSWLFRQIGKAFNGEVLDRQAEIQEKQDEFEKKFDDHLELHAKEQAETSRQRILRFADEIYSKKKHSKESFEDILDIIANYDNYCDTHENFKNGRTHKAAELIDKTYNEIYREHKFAEVDHEWT